MEGSTTAPTTTTTTTTPLSNLNTSTHPILRPVIFVVDATQPLDPSHTDLGDEPFDVRRTSLASTGELTVDSTEKENLYDVFLAALQGKPPGSANENLGGGNIDEDISIAASFASSAPPYSPREDESVLESPSPSHPKKGFFSPFSRLRKGRWKSASSPGGGAGLENDEQTATTTSSTTAAHVAIAQDMEDEDQHTSTADSTSLNSDNISSALTSYSRDNPPVNFISKRARIVNVSRKHAFPPSKFPKGKMDPMASTAGSMSGIGTSIMLGEQMSTHGGVSGGGVGGNSWMSSYEIQNEGILPSGWLEKHARALPSSIIIVTKLSIASEESKRRDIKNATRAVEDLRMTLAEKRSVPIHLVCLLNGSEVGKDNRRDLNAIKEKICQECYLPQSLVFLLKAPCDLEPDEFETGILSSPYLDVQQQHGVAAGGGNATVMMNPLLRQLDRSLRDESAIYYSRLADAHERKLQLWRNRYHNTNASFEVNTLLAAMRCARYAMKVGTLREFQMRTGATVGNTSGGGRWTDKSSSAMRHYDEAYRWIVELHRRAIAWRATALSSSAPSSGTSSTAATGMSFPSPAPITPGGKMYSVDDIASPKLTESPGGGIGVELSFPGAAAAPPPPPGPPSLTGATPPPPMRRNSPALTSKKGYSAPENIAFFASLWEQCRCVASIINAKLLRSTSNTANSYTSEAEEQWCRHRIIFLSNPRNMPEFVPSGNDDFFGPAWHRYLYLTEEMLTFACIAEGRWRRHALAAAASSNNATPTTSPSTVALSPSYHQPGAPWKAYGELCEAMLGLRKAVLQQMKGDGNSNEWLSSSTLSDRRKFVGSIVSGESGFGTMTWRFGNESKRDHRALSLDYVLHALDLLDENLSLSSGDSNELPTSPINEVSNQQQPKASARLHYLAARLLMSLENPSRALVHLKIAADLTKTWPSLHLSIQRALFTCEERCATATAESSDSCIELLLRSESCKLLSPKERMDMQQKGWNYPSIGNVREVVWTHDDTCKTKPPFEFAVSFLKSTHATSNDVVKACVSIKSCLDFPVHVESMQLVTTSGTFDIANPERCMADKSLLQSWIRSDGAEGTSVASKHVPNLGIQFESSDLAFFLTEISLPSNLTDIALGGSAVDITKFTPKNGRLSNMGLSHAAGNICESRYEAGSQEKISINGKPIALSSISEASSSFLGGIPLACHGLVLNLKKAGSTSSIKLRIERPRLVSPLLRSGAQQLLMEESNYTSHSWSRPAHHPWCLGPRVLRVLGPRPHMHVTNLTESHTNSKAVEGTVNRIVIKLEAGSDEDCWDVRVRLNCNSSKKQPTAESDIGMIDVEPHQLPTFVRKSTDPTVKIVTNSGVVLPEGWEQRKDVATAESHDTTTPITSHLEAGKSILCPLDIFRPLGQLDTSTCSTSYDVVILYRQIRAGGKNSSNDSGDQVSIVQSGTIEWIPPFAAQFSQTNGSKNPFPCGIQHASNMVSQSSTDICSDLIAADGERIQMRCSLQAKGLGSNVAASILRVTNEKEMNEQQKELYTSGSGLFINQMKLGSKLSLSYSVPAQRDIESGKRRDAIPLGIISVDWKPASLPLPENLPSNGTTDDFEAVHGPLSLPKVAPMVFYGPQCQVLPSPFKAKLLKCPSTPKVGNPFCISYQVTNRTAKSQTLLLRLDDEQDVGAPNPASPQLLGSGKLKEELQMAPFEEKTFSFTYISMVAGKVLRPPLTVSSGRHQTWVINETVMSSRHLFVMP